MGKGTGMTIFHGGLGSGPGANFRIHYRRTGDLNRLIRPSPCTLLTRRFKSPMVGFNRQKIETTRCPLMGELMKVAHP